MSADLERNARHGAVKISAILVTRYGQPHWLPVAALRSLVEQTYRPLELVIVAPRCWVVDEVHRWDWDIPVVEILDEGQPLGVLRRAAVEAASGDWIVWWDDDDYSHPDRLVRQWNATVREGGSYSLLRRQIRYSFPDNAAVELAGPQFSGTLLARRDILLGVSFPSLTRGEDLGIYHSLREQYGEVLLDYEELGCSRSAAACLFVKLFHGENAWKDGDFFLAIRKVPGYWNLDPVAASYLRRLLHEKYGVTLQTLDAAYWRSS